MTNLTPSDLIQIKYAAINLLDLISRAEQAQKPVSNKEKAQREMVNQRLKSLSKNKKL